ncbi:LacI family DNA-binding transcriptional regulator [Subtercola sp. RTI3]|uniref:LacI family DNA-binding transcriptional regulator n=1 Tax=Subtercola sp. RTI3 TaxID=3048639 RepID=UPI002B23A6C8|nr:LacI family DNA-binding transcriptional regulator [Subtercola sp. RTI3]MEA9984237.1 LacI family DNA-binding transcriptional regulator [Subtercola sp. RTI3]
MAITSRDVARLAGVSQPTVSRALRDDPRVSEATKAKVRAAAEQLGYVPSEAGRALSSGRTRRIGLLITDIENQFYTHIIAPVHLQLERLGYQLMLHTETADNDTIVERLIANGLDGVILATTTVDSVVPLRLRDHGLPFVYFNRTTSFVDADATVVEPTAGFEAAASRAVALGHTRIGAVLGPSNTSTAQSREVALRAALATNGLSLSPDDIRRGPFDTRTGDEATTSLLSQPSPPTLLFCANDVVAYGALNAASRRGVSVPGDLSIVGFDDLPAASWPIIELSTIAYDLTAMAGEAARLITRRIEQPDASVLHVEYETSFVERRTLSSAPLSD